MSFGENLKYYRNLARYTQKELAQLVDVGLSTYNKYEKNEYQPKFDTLLRICDVLEVSPNELLGYKKQPITLTSLGFEIVSENNDDTTTLRRQIYKYDEKFSIIAESVIFTLENKYIEIILRDIEEKCNEARNIAYESNTDYELAQQLLKYFSVVQFKKEDCITNEIANCSANQYIKLVQSLLNPT